MNTSLKPYLFTLLSYFLPSSCLGCRHSLPVQRQDPFCEPCLSDIRLLSNTQCERCGDPFVHTEIASHVCGDCLVHPPPFQKAQSVFELDSVLMRAIHTFKYHGGYAGLGWFGEQMSRCVQSSFLSVNFDAIVPVPLHSHRLMRRGYNQSMLLARELQQRLQVPIESGGLARKVSEKPQSQGTRLERLKQVRGIFEKTEIHRFKGKKILLVDDVYTTGSTVRECARALQPQAEVYVITLARTLRKGPS